ncbi:MAG TPA: hypothetical protein PJ986_04650 [Gammaproteobacteria bacterium]|mgnify:CR=1 FL=1|nr:hypothetical protein [Gammaproteobacteria bacterium]
MSARDVLNDPRRVGPPESKIPRYIANPEPSTLARDLLQAQDTLTPEEWLVVVGQHWAYCDRLTECAAEYAEIFEGLTDSGIRLMMDLAADAAWLDLPDVVTLYRGCFEGINEPGLSWTLSRKVAAGFPFLAWYLMPEHRALLLSCRVPKSRVALSYWRGEFEAISPDAYKLARAGKVTREYLLPPGAGQALRYECGICVNGARHA